MYTRSNKSLAFVCLNPKNKFHNKKGIKKWKKTKKKNNAKNYIRIWCTLIVNKDTKINGQNTEYYTNQCDWCYFRYLIEKNWIFWIQKKWKRKKHFWINSIWVWNWKQKKNTYEFNTNPNDERTKNEQNCTVKTLEREKKNENKYE